MVVHEPGWRWPLGGKAKHLGEKRPAVSRAGDVFWVRARPREQVPLCRVHATLTELFPTIAGTVQWQGTPESWTA